MVKPVDELTGRRSKPSSPLTGEGIVIDLGTGDGVFVYQAARRNPNKFYIGIDANPQPLEKISEKIHRKPAQGGAPNVLFLQAAAEALPPELDGVADEVHIHFPWGSLLRAVVTGDEAVLRGLRRVCAPDALLEIVTGLDPTRDQTEITSLAIPELTQEYLDQTLVPRFESFGFRVLKHRILAPYEWEPIDTSWAKRLRMGSARSLVYLVAQAVWIFY